MNLLLSWFHSAGAEFLFFLLFIRIVRLLDWLEQIPRDHTTRTPFLLGNTSMECQSSVIRTNFPRNEQCLLGRYYAEPSWRGKIMTTSIQTLRNAKDIVNKDMVVQVAAACYSKQPGHATQICDLEIAIGEVSGLTVHVLDRW